ncbi:MAG: hypothetical protein K2X55_05930 [Burkholderiaceae bacterium]|nr:hypothetical protein [Burkholderiaceae bacterium]
MKKLIAAAVAATFAMGSAFAQIPVPTPEVAAHAPAKKASHKKVAHKKAHKKVRKAAV